MVKLLYGVVVVMRAYQNVRLPDCGITQSLAREPFLHVPDLVTVSEAD